MKFRPHNVAEVRKRFVFPLRKPRRRWLVIEQHK